MTNPGPWATMDQAMDEGGQLVRQAVSREGGSLQGWVAVEVPGGWGVNYAYSVRVPGTRKRVSRSGKLGRLPDC